MHLLVSLNQAQTFETSDKILKNAKFDVEIGCRLAGISDPKATEGKYHLKGYTRFLRNVPKIPQDDQEKDKAKASCLEEVMTLLQKRLL